MALIKCPECRHEISDKAISCPTCSFPLAEHNKDKRKSENEKYYIPSIDNLKKILFPKKISVKCPECNNKIPEGATSCPKCACPIVNKTNQYQEKQVVLFHNKGEGVDIKIIDDINEYRESVICYVPSVKVNNLSETDVETIYKKILYGYFLFLLDLKNNSYNCRGYSITEEPSDEIEYFLKNIREYLKYITDNISIKDQTVPQNNTEDNTQTKTESSVSLVWGILAIAGMFSAMSPCFGALNWLNIPFAGLGLIVSIMLALMSDGPKTKTLIGSVLCAVAILVGFIRLLIGGGIF